MKDVQTGVCRCGATRYEITGSPVTQLMCFCSDCRAFTGSDAFAAYIVKQVDFSPTEGSPKFYATVARSGRAVKRYFCDTCGSSLWAQLEIGLVSVAGGSLDDVELFQPVRTNLADEAPAWARIPDSLEAG